MGIGRKDTDVGVGVLALPPREPCGVLGQDDARESEHDDRDRKLKRQDDQPQPNIIVTRQKVALRI
jgi:hypothetical protein